MSKSFDYGNTGMHVRLPDSAVPVLNIYFDTDGKDGEEILVGFRVGTLEWLASLTDFELKILAAKMCGAVGRAIELPPSPRGRG